MPWELKVVPELRLVELRYSGSVNLAEREQARDAVIGACFAHGYARALVDMRASDIRLSDREALRFAAAFEPARLPRDYRLACVITQERESEKLIEIVIGLEGVNIKYFYNPDAARTWLTAV